MKKAKEKIKEELATARKPRNIMKAEKKFGHVLSRIDPL